jgi:hypothetical protein
MLERSRSKKIRDSLQGKNHLNPFKTDRIANFEICGIDSMQIAHHFDDFVDFDARF